MALLLAVVAAWLGWIRQCEPVPQSLHNHNTMVTALPRSRGVARQLSVIAVNNHYAAVQKLVDNFRYLCPQGKVVSKPSHASLILPV